MKSKVVIAASHPLPAGGRRPRPAETLFAVSKAVGSRRDIAEVLRETTRELVRALAADIGSVWRLDPGDHELRPVADYGAVPRLRPVSLNTSLVAVLLKDPSRADANVPVYSSNSAADPRFDHPLLRLIPHRSLLIQPFRSNGRMAGVFAFIWTRSRHRFTDVELRLVEAVTQQAGIAIENADLLEKVHRFNRQLERRVRDRTSRLKLANEALRASREELRALSTHMEGVREAERTRIAREIHDELGQALTGLKLDLALLSGPQTLSGAIDNMIAAVQRIATELRPPILDDLGLGAALEWHALEFEKRTGVKCRFRCTGGLNAIDGERSTALFRIFQEILTNVARHARATRVQIALVARRTTVRLVVHDNGRGIGEMPQTHHRRLGLLGMQERAAAFGGVVAITGAAGKGTTVRVRIPLVPATRSVRS